ncbi:phosphonate ABC transporter, ATPase subunit [Paenibacillus vortex V453]|jgi:phosphonate transport system ATP-binding protein|uniref:Phosphonate ABC transporter, ATPase subunit n=1 Tax=Paenibacillus vortex V453 TaxID=715225 RepID=A0A2R9SR84_9BACL|nr:MULTISPECIES: phosphonate ABC transporter ATP-binding protein [Paenibacillus]ANA82954.1 phosphonate ABC transporter ATP-binding protein [Paenibacillus glucanolyticus]AVV57960.1 phosphonate ABC transporter ATP-binding protein [Paenibacillus glucanolyticus]AWP27120.1 phosphonate ABC transporter ATP-binding protein [Paenibacillus sp. Cedars]EFU39884.1 phosphonate ABC transporter, ATPase subunit [Paenibacillus vortex V453]ETT34758.1 phosphonate ABC transporter ATPase [Paenibacillus sp. FSL R5-8
MKALLEVRRVSKKYGNGSTALSDVSFSIQEGEFVSIIGPSGAGKSTLLRCINRMIEVSSGEVVFQNVNVTKLGKKQLKQVRRTIGMIFQHYNLVNRLSVIENVLHGRLGYKSTLAGMLGLYNEEEKKKAVEILAMLGLQDQIYKRADQLSGGQKQRVGIARALVQEPKLLLCDEPIASLDPNASKTIMDYLKTISTTLGITVLVNLHQVDVALKYSDRIIGVNKGRIIYDGVPREMTSDMIHNIYGSETGDLLFDLGGENAG